MKDEARDGRFQIYFAALHRFEDVFLAVLLSAMVLLAPLQILLRNLFDQGITWADPLIRALVLWVGLLGAVAASRGDRHISIDAVSRMIDPRARTVLAGATSLFTAVVSALVAWHSGRFVLDERAYGSMAFSGIPAWLLQSIIPIAFGLIAIRYLLRARHQGLALLTGQTDESLATGSNGAGGAD